MKIEIDDNKKWQHSLTLKLILLGVMGLFFLIPLEMIKSVIRERQKTSENVRKEIAFQWSGEQNVSGPVLNIPVKYFSPAASPDSYRKEILHIMPDNLEISGTVRSEKRHRSIYRAIVYNADLVFSGDFAIPEFPQGEKREVLWDESYYTIGISDNRGLKGSVLLNAGPSVIEAVPGLRDTEVFQTGITFPASPGSKSERVPFKVSIRLAGSESLHFTPLGRKTNVKLDSDWASPRFSGNFLPAERKISESGFNAGWSVTNLNRNFPQSWTGASFSPGIDSFGVDFVIPVDHYQKSLRSAKYGILFIALTFLALLFTEMSGRERLHIFHYLLVSLALVLFFSLLNALAEQLGFNLAYLISSVSTIGLIFLFLWKLVRNKRTVIVTAALLIFLYSFIYILLTLNDYAYLAGNIGLFILLAVTMMLSLRLKALNVSAE